MLLPNVSTSQAAQLFAGTMTQTLLTCSAVQPVMLLFCVMLMRAPSAAEIAPPLRPVLQLRTAVLASVTVAFSDTESAAPLLSLSIDASVLLVSSSLDLFPVHEQRECKSKAGQTCDMDFHIQLVYDSMLETNSKAFLLTLTLSHDAS
jgi:hypothetical protein